MATGNPRELPATVSEPAMVRFGIFELDLKRRELRRKGVLIKLQQQPYEILRLLVTHRGEWVSRELIQQGLWPDGRFVDFERGINTAIMKLRHALRESASAPAYIETAPRLGYRLMAPVVEPQSETTTSDAIAILPLEDLSNNPDTQFFVDGLTDALITEMARLSGLRVVSRTTMQRYKNSSKTVREIAAELKVPTIVEGSVLRSGDRIRISARLLDAVGDRHLWAQTYERDLKDILSLQQELVTAIACSTSKAVRQESQPAPAKEIAPKAYEGFLRGNFLLSLRAPKSLAKAIECYDAAMVLEPNWAPPYAALAEAKRIQHFMHQIASAEVVDNIRALTDKALALDPSNAQAHATLGTVLAMHLWRWNEGESRIQRALGHNPQSAHVEHLYSTILLAQGRYEEALAHIERALAIEHSSLFLRSHRVQVLLFARRYEECIRESEDLLEENSEFVMGLMNYGAALLSAGRAGEAIPVLERAEAISPLPVVLAALAEAQYLSNERWKLQETLQRLDRMYRESGAPSTTMALGSLAAGRTDEAIEWIEKAFQEHDVRLPLLSQTTPFDRIRKNEKVTAILKSVYRDASL